MGSLRTLGRMALPSVPVVNQLPGVRKHGGDFTGLTRTAEAVVERDAVEAYAAVCTFPRKDTAPLTYPHVLAFPLHAEILGSRDFPFPAIGLVHIENTITQHVPVPIRERLDLTVTAEPPRPHRSGRAVDFVTTATAAGETVWEERSTYLKRGPGSEDASAGLRLEVAAGPGMTWSLPDNLGRRYAAVSGDANPIHLHPLTAKALGFPRHIAHGMWTLAACVAALENRLPDAVTVEAAFKKPVFLPGRVTFTTEGDAFSLTNPKDGSPHLVGRTLPA